MNRHAEGFAEITKAFVINKSHNDCGHWSIIMIEFDTLFPGSIIVSEVAHCENFGDILYLLNLGAMVD
jgi:hypothetical protein